MIDKGELFAILKRRKKSELLEILNHAFDEMPPKTRRAVFLDLIQKSRPAKLMVPLCSRTSRIFTVNRWKADTTSLLISIPRTLRHIPEGTDEWCDRIADLLKQATELTSQGDHDWAAKCFDLLFDLIGKMEYGEEIVFADEMGSWMIPIDDKDWIPAYMTSLAATAKPGNLRPRRSPWSGVTAAIRLLGGIHVGAEGSEQGAVWELDAEIRVRKVRTP